MKTLKKRVLSIICMIAFGICLSFGQTSTIKHVVDRGETLASIAKRYSTTESQIIQLNPNARQFIYVGMELVIPQIEKQVQTKQQIEEPTDKPLVESTLQHNENPTPKAVSSKPHSATYSASDFTSYGISYFAPFDNADQGFYMLGGEVYYDNGWGIDMKIGFNYGLVNKDYAGCAFLIGPTYGYAYNKLLFSTSLDFLGTYRNTGEENKKGTNAIGEEITYKGTGSKFNWGIALMPKIAIKIEKVVPWIGVNAQWSKDADKLSFGFQIGIGFDI